MRARPALPLLALLLAGLAGGAGLAQEPAAAVAPAAAEAPARTLVVATRQVAPFAMRDSRGNWEGLSVDLWQDVADKIGVVFEWRELGVAETLEALEAGEVDVAIAALTVTAEREQRIDFSYPYLASGLALAVDGQRRSGWWATLRGFFSAEFLSAVGALLLILMAAAAGVWIFERRANPEQFGGSTVRGLGESFWWSAVTMTTVGYGDRAPVTLGGRLVALVWMFTSVIVIAGFTASIAASVTVHRLESDLLDERRLASIRLAVLADSRAAAYGERRGLRLRPQASLEAAADALVAGRVDAILHDAPVLRYLARERVDDTLEVLPGVVVRDDYGFGLPAGSALRKRVNVALLSIVHGPVWQGIRERYLGADAGG